MCKYEYVVYAVIRGELYYYATFSTCEEALTHAAAVSGKQQRHFKIWKRAENPAFSLCGGLIFDAVNGAIHPVF